MRRAEKAAAGVLLVLSLLPIWLYPLFPSQDGPSHLYNSVIFTDLWAHEKGFFAQFYDLNWRPFPNWTFTILASLLHPLLWINTVEKILLSAYLVGFVSAVFYFLRSISAEKTAIGFGAFLLGYNWHLLMGFYNFCFSVPLALVTIGYCIRHRGFIHGGRMCSLMGLLLALYFSHVVSFGLALLVVAILFGFFGQRRLSALGELVVPCLPAAACFLIHLSMQPGTAESFLFPPPKWSVMNALSLRIGPLFHGWEIVWLFALWTLLIAWLVMGLPQIRQWHPETRIWALVLGLVIVLCLVMPNNALGGSALNERFAFYTGLFLLPALSLRAWTLPRWILVAGFLVLFAAQQVYLHVTFWEWNQRLAPFHRAAGHLQPASKVLPLMFAPNEVGFYVNPLLHADSYSLIPNRCVSPTNYEAHRTYFPLRYKWNALPTPTDWYKPESFLQHDMARHYDYVLVWNAHPSVFQSPALRTFTEVFAERDVHLLKRR